jgi:glycosyltransferase involved in cell wall biosynthesis
MNPLVSVIIPNYRHADFLARRIQSVLDQTVTNLQIIILDDASPDHSLTVIKQFSDPRISLHVNEKNSGNPFVQWNKGARLASGKYLWIAESDDWASPGFLENLLPRLENNPRAVLAYSQSLIIDENDHPFSDSSQLVQKLDSAHWQADHTASGVEECRRFLCAQNTIPNASAVLIRKETFDAVAGADESFRICGDWHLWIRLALRGELEYLHQPLNHWRTHPQTVRSGHLKTAIRVKEALAVMKLAFDQARPDPSTQRLARRKLWRYWLGHAPASLWPTRANQSIYASFRQLGLAPLSDTASVIKSIITRQ